MSEPHTVEPTVLTVDDSSVQRRSLLALFRPFRCRLFEAANGREGLAAIREHRPDLVLLDYNMPVLDGLGMLRELRADADIAGTRVIMITTDNTPPTLAAAARLGVRDHLVKPHHGPTLLAKAARLIPLVPRAGDTPSIDEPAPRG